MTPVACECEWAHVRGQSEKNGNRMCLCVCVLESNENRAITLCTNCLICETQLMERKFFSISKIYATWKCVNEQRQRETHTHTECEAEGNAVKAKSVTAQNLYADTSKCQFETSGTTYIWGGYWYKRIWNAGHTNAPRVPKEAFPVHSEEMR